MIKEYKIMKESIERRKYCDVCGVEIQFGLAGSKAKCGYCGKDLCEKCIGREEPSWSDYRGEIWCKNCWKIGEEYRPLIEELNTTRETLYEKWQSRCKEKIERIPT